MFQLVVPTILTSAVDSLNPVAIAQQFALQGAVKKPRDIWYYILPIGLTNFLGGIFAYFGLINIISQLVHTLATRYQGVFLTMEIIVAALFLWLALRSVRRARTATSDQHVQKIKQVSPKALILLGIAATISELITAVPYFAFLGLIFQTAISSTEIIVLLALYNLIYIAPLIAMYFVYSKAQVHFDRFYLGIQTKISKWSRVLTPLIFLMLALVVCGHIVWQLIF